MNSERPLPPIPESVIMRNTYYAPDNLRRTVEWAKNFMKTSKSEWERNYLRNQIARIELALATGRAT